MRTREDLMRFGRAGLQANRDEVGEEGGSKSRREGMGSVHT